MFFYPLNYRGRRPPWERNWKRPSNCPILKVWILGFFDWKFTVFHLVDDVSIFDFGNLIAYFLWGRLTPLHWKRGPGSGWLPKKSIPSAFPILSMFLVSHPWKAILPESGFWYTRQKSVPKASQRRLARLRPRPRQLQLHLQSDSAQDDVRWSGVL